MSADTLTDEVLQKLLARAEQGVTAYLNAQRAAGRIAENYAQDALKNVLPNLRQWLTDAAIDRIDGNLRFGIEDAIMAGRWEDLVNAYVRRAAFSATGGIRQKMASDKASILKLKKDGIDARILKGSNTLNNLILLLTAGGVARYGRDHGFTKFVVGFDSRVRGRDLAGAIAQLLLAEGFRVYLFDEACMFPNVSFAVPTLGADCGIFISASHNDYRYNGFKITAPNGGQMENAVRNSMYDDYILKMRPADIQVVAFAAAPKDQLWFLGGTPSTETFAAGEHAGLPIGTPLPEADYAGRADQIIDMHSLHVAHVKTFLLDPAFLTQQRENPRRLNVGYSAFHGSGRTIVPRLLSEVGVVDVKRIMKLDALDGLFPSFSSDPGHEQQPDPGDARAAEISVAAFKKEYPEAWGDLDIIIGTDPDADRCGVVMRLLEHERPYYDHKDFLLLPADDVWALVLWYRLFREAAQQGGTIPDADAKFIGMTATTNELVARVARKYGLGVMKTWVGFVMLSTGVTEVWRSGKLPEVKEGRAKPDEALCHPYLLEPVDMNTGRRSFNVAAIEQSAGMSVFGGPPADNARQLGVRGHVRDKDGTFASLLLTEVAAYAKDQGKTLLDLLNALYLDPDIGLFVNFYEPDPLDGEFPGLPGESHKKDILMAAMALHERVQTGQSVVIGGKPVVSSVVYWTGKYDKANWQGFPDEGIRFYFTSDTLNGLIIRPSGTSNSLRFHVQLHDATVTATDVREKKARLLTKARVVADDIRRQIGAPREFV